MNIRYLQAEDYPIDLYYLLDLSNSTRDYKDKLLLFGDSLSKSIRNVTTNFRLGLGSIDIFHISNNSLLEPCIGCNKHDFKNIMALNNDTDSFSVSHSFLSYFHINCTDNSNIFDVRNKTVNMIVARSVRKCELS